MQFATTGYLEPQNANWLKRQLRGGKMKSLLIAINMRLCFQLRVFSQVQSDRNWEGVWSKKPMTLFASCIKPCHNLMDDEDRHYEPG